MDLGQDLTVLATAINFDIGLPGLGLEVKVISTVLVGYELGSGVRTEQHAGLLSAHGEEDEIKVDFEVRIPDLRGRGELGLPAARR